MTLYQNVLMLAVTVLTVPRLTAVVALLQKRLPGIHVVVVAVLPRGWAGKADYSWPNAFTKVTF